MPDEGIEQPDDDFRCLIDWPLFDAKAKSSNLRLYQELFGEHPTWGVGERTIVLETGTTSEDNSRVSDDDDDNGNLLLAGELLSN